MDTSDFMILLLSLIKASLQLDKTDLHKEDGLLCRIT
jgi:hypothetical protein